MFHGGLSSLALLSYASSMGQHGDDSRAANLLASLSNPNSRSTSTASPFPDCQQIRRHPSYASHCRAFSESYFSSLYYIFPFLDKAAFLARCEKEIWSQCGAPIHTSSFAALYHGVLSLGALVGIRHDEPTGGLSNMQWSQMFFDEAKRCCHQLECPADLEIVQCYFIMVSAKTNMSGRTSISRTQPPGTG